MMDGKMVFTEYLILPTKIPKLGSSWENYYKVFEWTSKAQVPPKGTFHFRSESGRELYYWPTIPFDLAKEKSANWLKWTEIDFPKGGTERMIIPRDPDIDINNRNLDWSMDNYISILVWQKMINKDKEKKMKKLEKEKTEFA